MTLRWIRPEYTRYSWHRAAWRGGDAVVRREPSGVYSWLLRGNGRVVATGNERSLARAKRVVEAVVAARRGR